MEHQEEWAEHTRYPEYEFSSLGRIRNRSSKYTYKLSYHEKGYVQLYIKDKHGDRKSKRVHRLVYEAFYGGIPDGLHVHHKNSIRDDNRLSNLELLTPHENVQLGVRNRPKRIGTSRYRLIQAVVHFCKQGLGEEEIIHKLRGKDWLE